MGSLDLTNVVPAGSRRRCCCLADEPLDLEFCMAVGGSFSTCCQTCTKYCLGFVLPHAAMYVCVLCSADA